MNQAIEDFVACRHLAVVGASRSGKKFGNAAYKELKQRGFDVYLVHPEAKEIEGEPCFANLAELRGRVDGVVISVPLAQVPDVLRDAAATDVHYVWLQQGAESPEALALAGELGLNAVGGKCILMYAQPVRSYHGWHRGAMRLFGRL